MKGSEIETLTVVSVRYSARADGRLALIFQRPDGRELALEMTPERIDLLLAKLSELRSLARKPGRA